MTHADWKRAGRSIRYATPIVVEEAGRHALHLKRQKDWSAISHFQGSDIIYLFPAHDHDNLHVRPLVHGSLKQSCQRL